MDEREPIEEPGVEPAAPREPEVPATGPDWPPWFGFLGFVAAVVAAVTIVSVIGAAAGLEPGDSPSWLTVVGTLLQGAFFVIGALFLASTIARPRLWHFGLRRAPLRPTVRLAAKGMAAFYVVTVAYAMIVRPDVEQDVVERLGAEEGALSLIGAGVMVMIVAPLVEEVFFRGFFYRALRSRMTVIAAAVVNGIVFGFVHYDFEGLNGLLLLPPLAFLGGIFCIVYERTGTLWAVIGMHAFNNTIAFTAQTPDGWRVALVLGPLAIAGCFLAPRLLPDGPRSLPGSSHRVGPDPQLSLPVE